MWLNPDLEEAKASKVDAEVSYLIGEFKQGNPVYLDGELYTPMDIINCVWGPEDNDLLVKSLSCFMDEKKGTERDQFFRSLESKVYNFLRRELEK